YVKGFPGAAELRNQLMSTKSTDEVRGLLDKFEASVGEAQNGETV
ncbi:tRNA-dihydrouridine synthase, partial [Bacillus sp. HC-TM]